MSRIYIDAGTATSTAIGWGNITDNYVITHSSSAETETRVEIPTQKTGSEKRISPKLYFSYVKSKLQKTELTRLKNRLSKLQTLTKNAFDLRQEALYQEFSKMIAVAVRESEAVACGYDTWVSIQDIEKFMKIAKEEGAKKSPIYFKKLEDFSRSIPWKVQKLITDVKAKGIFNQLWVLYLDYTHEELKTNKDKIREKDPILFGQFSFQKDRYFYLTAWVDDYCDLTLEKFVEKLGKNHPDFELGEVPEIDCAFVERIRKEVEERQARLEGTNSGNYKKLMEEEDKRLDQEIAAKEKKKPWYKKLGKGKKNV